MEQNYLVAELAAVLSGIFAALFIKIILKIKTTALFLVIVIVLLFIILSSLDKNLGYVIIPGLSGYFTSRVIYVFIIYPVLIISLENNMVNKKEILSILNLGSTFQ